ncbi:sulfite exporter TauE/SafE family protein [Bacillus carboniphilus]|uniref:Probable membrane transporter protein n=1 Tax=Bacillus carboniphilus TaxID=86663 RepID=A0ABY9JSF2_9BACI|nr:sulfite exporter TauE/SafE family protein [Bacillus carboniphilus]WLR41312.1 sulfite exporter TauE/SafE family protein [Bacillus carboniphilus]
MDWIVILIFLGFVAGVLGSLIGLGGGVIIVPSLLFLGAFHSKFSGLTPQMAVGTSLVIIIGTALSSTLAYMKYKKIDYKSGLLFFLGSGPGGIVGAFINKYLNAESFSLWFGLFMIFLSIVLMVKNYIKPLNLNIGTKKIRTYIDDTGEEQTYSIEPIIAVSIAFIVGLLSGLFGIGGGSLMVPAMILLFAFPPHIAVGTSMFMILLSAILSSSTHIYLGHVNWLFTMALLPGAWFGSKLGAWLNQRMKSETVVRVLRMVLIIIGIRLIF